jgi:hypothetical protein
MLKTTTKATLNRPHWLIYRTSLSVSETTLISTTISPVPETTSFQRPILGFPISGLWRQVWQYVNLFPEIVLLANVTLVSLKPTKQQQQPIRSTTCQARSITWHITSLLASKMTRNRYYFLNILDMADKWKYWNCFTVSVYEMSK